MFTHLHVHTEFSLLDGMCRIPALIARAKELGMDTLAITDHGVMHGAIQFYQEAKKQGIKPIIGCEIYIAQGSRTGRTNGDKKNDHLVLLAKDQAGYRNLIQLTTKAHVEGFYYKPRVDKELLEQYHEGLVALSACLGGEVPRLILEGRLEEAKQAARWYKDTFGDFYLEIQRHPITELEQVNQHLIDISRETGIPLVATNDTHYIKREDAPYHDLLLCIGTNTTVQEEKRVKMAGDFFYLKSPAEMANMYQDIPDALENTGIIAEMCNLKLEFGRLHLPEIETPKGKTPDEFLSGLCYENLPDVYPDATPAVRERLDSELAVIKQTGFANYILVVWDITAFAKKNNILFNIRGSAASSIVLYCLGMTEMDPVANELVSERFLNPERIEMPDIDLDLQDDRREEAIAYVTRKYGADHVAQIITFGTLGARAALRDVGRALGMAYGDVDRVAKLVPAAPNMTLNRAMDENYELKNLFLEDAAVRKLIDAARHVEGVARHASTHAAGVVISKEPLVNHVPLQLASRANGSDAVMTQFVMEDIAAIGLLKMDFLGLANLTILGRAKDIIKQNRGVDIDLHRLPLDDRKTYQLLSAGQTTGVFQLEGMGMRRYIRELKPTIFGDIAAMVALYRPGPIEHIPEFIAGKHGDPSKIKYMDETLRPILESTYGVIVYQEQVLFIARAIAGFTLGQADVLRKAMGKKIAEVMKKEKLHFLEGAKKKGFTSRLAEDIFALIEPFSGYAFNKAHAVNYAFIAYQTAWLKANYPVEYITAFLVAHNGQPEKVASAVSECHRLGIETLPPDIQSSGVNFSIEKHNGKDAIRFGLAIKNVGFGAVEPVIAEREKDGRFRSIEDFCRRCDLRTINKRVLESLIKGGAFDSLEVGRGTLLNSLPAILSLAQREQKLKESGQSTMFDMFGQTAAVPMPTLELIPVETNDRDKSIWEKELLGVSFSRQLFSPPADASTTLCGELDVEMEGQVVTVIGEIVTAIPSFTKTNKPFVSATIADISSPDGIEVVAWSNVYEPTRDLWQEGNILIVTGKVRVRNDRAQLNCDRAEIYRPEAFRAVAALPAENASPEAASSLVNNTLASQAPSASKPGLGNGGNGSARVKEPATVYHNGAKAKSGLAKSTPGHRVIASEASPSASGNGRISPTPPQPQAPPRRLVISLAPTTDKDGDVARLNRIGELLREFPGKDDVILAIDNNGKLERYRFATTRYNDTLHKRLAEVVGEEGLGVETMG